MSETVKYQCDKCDYFTSRRFNYLKHIKTDKHKSQLLGDVHKMSNSSPPSPTSPTSPSNELEHRCPNCDRKYMAQRSLWRHSKQCQSPSKPETVDKAAFDIFKTTITELCKSNAELNKMNQIQHLQMTQMFTAFLEASKNMIVSSQQAYPAPETPNTVNNVTVHGDMTNTTNNANNTFNMSFFLNEQCKDAMNMSDFIKAIELDSDDMDYVTTNGYVKGISNIFINNLEKTDISKRPIHCSDSKREVLYIKDDDKWERDGINSKKLINAVKLVAHKNIINVNEWAKQHPECENSANRANDIYFKMSTSATDGIDENIAKVIKQVIQQVVIDKKELANQ